MFTVLRRLFLPAVSLVLGCVLLFVAFVLYPVFLCASDTFTSKQIQRHGYVAFHGLVADLSQATTNRTAYIHSQFAGMDISSLVPRMLWLARTPDGSYADKDIRQCVNDPVVADAWLKLALADANGTTLAFQSPQPQQSGTSGTFTTLSKCARPRPLAVTVLDTRRRANLLMLAHQLWGLGELSPVPDEGAIDAQITATERSDLPKPQPPPVDLSVNCLVEPDALRDLFHNVVGHVRIDFDALGLDNDKVQQQREAAIARAVPSSPAKDDLRGGFVNMTDPVPGFGGLVAINDMVFDVAQYLAHATTYLSSNAASPSTRSSEYAVPREGDTMFLSRSVTELLSHAHGRMPLPGGDRDLGWQRLIRSDTDAKGITARSCLVKLFYIGYVFFFLFNGSSPLQKYKLENSRPRSATRALLATGCWRPLRFSRP
ncbi:hypothetical protein BC828DRAFT_376669 [Blastocladiella britannica]|nr:hypothetical protein BC828DRAFT_376669 [Blastocladiella britannica]